MIDNKIRIKVFDKVNVSEFFVIGKYVEGDY